MSAWVKKEVIGPHTLYLGDCLEVMDGFTENQFDAVVTDPPYGVNLTGKTQNQGKHKKHKPSILYSDSEKAIHLLIRKAAPEFLRASVCAGVFTGNRIFNTYPQPKSVGCAFEPAGVGLDQWGFTTAHMIFYFGNDPYLANRLGSRPNGFRGRSTAAEKFDHPAIKPLYWMRWLVERVSFPEQTILDPFMGSGTTGVACEQLGRVFTGIEIEPKYFDIVCKRIDEAVRHPTFKLATKPPMRKKVKSIFEDN